MDGLEIFLCRHRTPPEPPVESNKAELRTGPPYEVFAAILPEMLRALAEPRTEKDVEQSLGVVPVQAKAWLRRACEEGHVRKLGRPARYLGSAKPPLLFDRPEGNTRESQAEQRN